MVPTLWGRIQTRVVILVVIGGLATAALTPWLPIDAGLSSRYRSTFTVLAAVTILGVGWEFLYHFLMQWRWEKDWPAFFGLITCVPEGTLVWVLAAAGLIPGLAGPLAPTAFVIHFLVVWLVVWLTAFGPMRVPFIRWRFQGGRLW